MSDKAQKTVPGACPRLFEHRFFERFIRQQNEGRPKGSIDLKKDNAQGCAKKSIALWSTVGPFARPSCSL